MIHGEILDQHRVELDDLADGHSKATAASEALRGEMRGLQETMRGLAVLLAVAVLVNNIPKGRRYPEFWF